MPEYADNKPALMRAYKSADVGKNGYVELKEFADFIVLLKFYHEIGAHLRVPSDESHTHSGKMFATMNVDNDRRISFDGPLSASGHVATLTARMLD